MPQRNTQRDRLEALLFENFGKEVGLPEIQRLGIAQHGARLNELRKKLSPRGLVITNRMETAADGTRHSWYRLDYRKPIDISPTKPAPAVESDYMRRVRQEQEQAAPLFVGAGVRQ